MAVFLFLCFCTPLAPQVLQYPPWSSQAPTALEGEGVKLTPCYVLAQCSYGHQYRRAKGFFASKWGVPGTEAFGRRASLCPASLGCAWGAVELPAAAPAAASWGHRDSPLPVLRLPKSLETHQLLSKPCNMGPLGEGRSGRKLCALLPAVVNLPGDEKDAPGEAEQG